MIRAPDTRDVSRQTVNHASSVQLYVTSLDVRA